MVSCVDHEKPSNLLLEVHPFMVRNEKESKMIANTVSPCITTEKVEESRDFYVKHFGARVTFDCGWYVNMQIGKESSELQFMAPRELGSQACNPAGLMYNFSVDDVDAEHARLTGAGLTSIMPLEDHPWGDRGFAILDPNGVMLYIFSPRQPAEEFKQYVKS